jgi:predicted membrane-bound spermidine synthase
MSQLAVIRKSGDKYKLYLNGDFKFSWEWAEATEAGIRYLTNYAKQKLRATTVSVEIKI